LFLCLPAHLLGLPNRSGEDQEVEAPAIQSGDGVEAEVDPSERRELQRAITATLL
jgi:hypothetical protein